MAKATTDDTTTRAAFLARVEANQGRKARKRTERVLNARFWADKAKTETLAEFLERATEYRAFLQRDCTTREVCLFVPVPEMYTCWQIEALHLHPEGIDYARWLTTGG